jgi:lipopolysaccharide export system protein LptC
MRRLAFALPLLVALGIWLATWRSSLQPPAAAPARAEAQPRYQVTDGHWIRYNERGESEFEATAERIEYFDDESARLSTLEMHSLGGSESPWRLSAPEGYAPPHSDRRMQLRGGVRAMGHWPEGEPLNFETQYLWVDEVNRQLYTDAPVLLRGKSRSAKADGLRAAWVGRSVELLGQVRMQYVLPPR